MPVYGYEIMAAREGFEGRAILRKEINATDSVAALTMLRGWLSIEGYGDGTECELIADGMTFREAGTRRMLDIAAELRTRFDVKVTGPIDHGAEHGGAVVVRVTLSNGRGLSLATDGRMLCGPAPEVEAMPFHDDEFLDGPSRNVDSARCVAMMAELQEGK